MKEELSTQHAIRVAIVSDTHGHLCPDVRAVVEGCNMAVHAGDIGSKRVLDVPQAGAGKVVVDRKYKPAFLQFSQVSVTADRPRI
jgi:hypothetical protein